MDLTKISDLRGVLKKFRVWSKKKLGQHFLVDRKILEKIVAAGEIQKNEKVVEIGAGTGVLTVELLRAGARVDAIEIDREILPVLNFTTKFAADNLQIFAGHVLSFSPPTGDFKIIANIPYNLTSPILRKFFAETETPPKKIIFLVQKEIAQKICDPRKSSVLQNFIAPFGRAEILEIVPSNAFFPAPKVESAILKIETFDRPRISVDRRLFFKILKAGFSSPRKMLKNNLANFTRRAPGEIEKILTKFEISLTARAENLTIENWENLARELLEKNSV